MVAEDKAALRARMKTIRGDAFRAKPQASAALAERFPEKLIVRFGPEVACYWPMRDEIDTRPLLNRLHGMGAQISLPRVEGNGSMQFHRWTLDAELVSGPFGLLQPASTADVVRPTLVLAPLLAFDTAGNRLGYGKGHYDRTIAELRKMGRVFLCGLAFSEQAIDYVPSEPTDIALDWAVTEAGSVPLFLNRAAPQVNS